jgi:hypothetical protein
LIQIADFSQAVFEHAIDSVRGIEHVDFVTAGEEALGEIENVAAGAAAGAFYDEEDAECRLAIGMDGYTAGVLIFGGVPAMAGSRFGCKVCMRTSGRLALCRRET